MLVILVTNFQQDGLQIIIFGKNEDYLQKSIFSLEYLAAGTLVPPG